MKKIMSEVNEETKWKIPYGITFEKLSKIIQLILRKEGDKKNLSLDAILASADLARNFLSSNLSFLNSIGIISGDNSGFKLTNVGSNFARALSLDNVADIKKISLEIIGDSHLNDIKILIENEGESIQKEKILKLIKTNAKISGNSVAEMPKTSKAGVNALLQWFNKIELIPDQIITTRIETKSDNKKSVKNMEKQPVDAKSNTNIIKGTGNFILNTNNISFEISSNIDLDELELAKKQVEMLFDHAKRKTQSKQTPNDSQLF